MRGTLLPLSAAALALVVASAATPSFAVHCGILTGDQFCDPDNVPAAGPFDEGTTNNDSVAEDFGLHQVNEDMILGRSNWRYGGQYDFDGMRFDPDDQDFDPGLTINPGD